MVNQKVVDYIKTHMAKGYSGQQLKDFLVKNGYKESDIDEALKSAMQEPGSVPTPPEQQNGPDMKNKGNISQGNDNTSQTQIEPTGGFKRREPLIVMLLGFITFGIYNLYWLVSTSNELRRNNIDVLSPWLLFLMLIPGVNLIIMLIYLWKYCKGINKLTGHGAGLLFFLYLIISPLAMSLCQIEINKKA